MTVTYFRLRLLASIFVGCWAISWTLSTSALGTEAQDTLVASIDNNPIVSPRAYGLGGALSTSADNTDAFFYNPAGISGNTYHGQSGKEPVIRQLMLPRLGVSANQSALALQSEFSSKGAVNDSQRGASILKTHDNVRQYARLSVTPVGLFLGNLGVVPVLDEQVSAIPSNTESSDVTFHYRTFSGAVVGTSLNDPKGHVSLGVSSVVGTITDTAGTAPYTDMVDVKARADILKANRKTYTSKSSNVGLTIRPPKKWSPVISIVDRNIGHSESPATSGGAPLIVKEDLTVGLGVAPPLGKWGRFHWTLEAAHLTNKHIAAAKKYRTGLELTFGKDNDSRALFGTRAGYNAAGGSCGIHINLGLIAFEISNHAVDVGSEAKKVLERRTSAVAYIDAASF